ncbi:hypothetical protein GCM10009737_09010 [Nocardioides lentus]|uniref:Acyl-CoA dehydrogenase n=1 Tax=Nocardioides lentus TaxID=338077 RepID=A0ABP5AC52_9ACTN
MDAGLPDAAGLAWWLTAWLRGSVSPDDALAGITGDDAPHRVVGLPAGADPSGDGVGWALAVGALRSAGAEEAGLALPVDGDPVGLGGPGPFNVAALEVGEAVVLGPLLPGQDGWGLVPDRTGHGVLWRALRARRRQLVDLGQADRDLRAALGTGAGALADLDVARWRPEVADELMDLRRRSRDLVAPPGTPTRCTELAARALQVLGIVDLALVDDGGALSVAEAVARRDALEPLARAGRRALVAACSPEVWPPA